MAVATPVVVREAIREKSVQPNEEASVPQPKQHMTDNDPVNEMERRLNKLLLQTDNPNMILLHFALAGEFAAELLTKNVLTDVVITCRGKCFHAHKCVLACHSDYFNKLFSEEPDKAEVQLNAKIDPECFKTTLDFMYRGYIENDPNANLVELLVVAERLRIASLSKKIRSKLNVTSSNCISVLTSAELVGLKDTYDKAYNYLMEHFLEVVSNDEFLELPLDKLCSLISNEEVYVTAEIDIFRAAVRWIYHNPEERLKSAERIMGCVKFILMSPEDLVKCCEEAYEIMDMDACKTMIFNANWYHTCERVGKTGKFKENIMGPRKLLIEL